MNQSQDIAGIRSALDDGDLDFEEIHALAFIVERLQNKYTYHLTRRALLETARALDLE